MTKIAPSILAADFARMGDEVKRAEQAGADWLHIDIMDGHFVPNLTIGPDMVKAIKKTTDLFLDVHLMVTNPEIFFEPFARAGADLISFHIEVDPNPQNKIKVVRNLDCQVGLSLNPDCPVESVLPFLDKVDLVLLMSVFPGYGGQKFIVESLERAGQLRSFIEKNNLSTQIEIDGGVNRTNAAEVVSAGVDILVMGSAFFGDDDPGALITSIKRG